MIKVFRRRRRRQLEKQINTWLKENPNYEIRLMSQSDTSISLLYEQPEQEKIFTDEEERKAQAEVDRIMREAGLER